MTFAGDATNRPAAAPLCSCQADTKESAGEKWIQENTHLFRSHEPRQRRPEIRRVREKWVMQTLGASIAPAVLEEETRSFAAKEEPQQDVGPQCGADICEQWLR